MSMATYNCVAKNKSPGITLDRKECNGGDQWSAETDQTVDPSILAEH